MKSKLFGFLTLTVFLAVFATGGIYVRDMIREGGESIKTAVERSVNSTVKQEPALPPLSPSLLMAAPLSEPEEASVAQDELLALRLEVKSLTSEIENLRRGVYQTSSQRPRRVAPTPVVPKPKLKPVPPPENAITADGRVNINMASIEELMTLPRIGPNAARQIVSARRSGSITSIEQLASVPFVGTQTAEILASRVVF